MEPTEAMVEACATVFYESQTGNGMEHLNNSFYRAEWLKVARSALVAALAVRETDTEWEGRAWFDRWLAARDREVAAKALREFESAAGQVGWDSPAVLLERLKARADRIEKGEEK